MTGLQLHDHRIVDSYVYACEHACMCVLFLGFIIMCVWEEDSLPICDACPAECFVYQTCYLTLVQVYNLLYFMQAGCVPLPQPIMWHNEETVGRRDAPSSSSPRQDVPQVKLSVVE